MENEVCIWEEDSRGKNDWYRVGCINSDVNPWKVAKKYNMTMVEIFINCPYCGKKVQPVFKK